MVLNQKKNINKEGSKNQYIVMDKIKEIDKLIKLLDKRGYDEELVERLEELEIETGYLPHNNKQYRKDKKK